MPLAVHLGGGIHRWRDAAEGDTLIEGHIVPELRRLADHQTGAVVDEQPVADGGAGMDVDAGQHPSKMRDDPPHKAPAAAPEPVPAPIEDQSVKTRIGKGDLQPGPGCGVPGDHAIDVVANVLEKHATQHDMIRPHWPNRRPAADSCLPFSRHIVCPTKLVKISPDVPKNLLKQAFENTNGSWASKATVAGIPLINA